ncbi:MAG: cytochrome o ubiquinol oxidase subunit [Patescibacteria group bacterium]|nr:cytochrome o ubiquinol oxidase subunit II [Candidatus Saccharibacteria bacterium]MDQ5963067.1 cytochrome o ubiquinol oxidase subunit [Patescibacteria group bacterium]
MPKQQKQNMSRGAVALFFVGIVFLVAFILWSLGDGHLFRLFETSGQVATKQRNLIVFTMLLSLVVLLPTYTMLYMFAWKYREGHKKQYKPDWDSNFSLEFVWWLIPIVIIGVLAVVTYKTSHSLDPYKPLASTNEPIQVQVVALNWKWLFIYPQEGVASVNEFAFPVDRPVELTLTSDGPMASFWAPELAGQIYVMAGMSTKLHVDANKIGIYEGVNSNITGKGYSDMRFKAKVMSSQSYEDWLTRAANSDKVLSATTLTNLRKETVANPVTYFALQKKDVYKTIEGQYMGHGMPSNEHAIPHSTPSMPNMQHTMEGM